MIPPRAEADIVCAAQLLHPRGKTMRWMTKNMQRNIEHAKCNSVSKFLAYGCNHDKQNM
jgi:hypothetical protein